MFPLRPTFCLTNLVAVMEPDTFTVIYYAKLTVSPLEEFDMLSRTVCGFGGDVN